MAVITGGYFFIIWIASGAVHMEAPSIGNMSGSSTDENVSACYFLQEAKKDHSDARLYFIGQGSSGMCDWGCVYPVFVDEYECEKQIQPQKEYIRAVPKEFHIR